jgi:hypothetical protein
LLLCSLQVLVVPHFEPLPDAVAQYCSVMAIDLKEASPLYQLSALSAPLNE